MNTLERRATLTLASLFSLRMLGLFMILPVFSPYAHQLSGATPFLIGVALGIYGLTQGLFQIPFGTLSDYYPRKFIIVLGFILFTVGSIIAAKSTTIHGVIIGRALQGAGAVGSVIIALLTDLMRQESRTKAMAIIGIIIGSSFFLALLIGPILSHFININGIFWLTALLGIIAIIITLSIVPTPEKRAEQKSTTPLLTRFKIVLQHLPLVGFDIGIFCLHAILMASFIVIPFFVHQHLKNQYGDWAIYAPTMLIAIVMTFAIIGFAERSKKTTEVYFLSILGLILSTILLGAYEQKLIMLMIGLILFFTSFNVLEANLPSLISRQVPPEVKGTAIGIYSTCQYMGVFVGGLLGGYLYGHTTPATVLFSCAIIASFWFVVALIFQSKNPAETIIKTQLF